MSAAPGSHEIDLAALALAALHTAGFHPEFSPEAQAEVQQLMSAAPQPAQIGNVADLRQRLWSSIDNDTPRDLDQVEVAERVPAGLRVEVAIADVSVDVPKDSALDRHAEAQTRTVYTGVRNFPMLPFELSTDLTSLNQDADRRAVVIAFTVDSDGTLIEESVSLATVRNHAQLAYSRVGPWLEANGAADAHSAAARAWTPEPWLAGQLAMQDEAARALQAARARAGALEFHRAEAEPVILDGRVASLRETLSNRAMQLVEELMVAANGVMARALRRCGRSALQRVVRVPQRWDRIVALAAEEGTTLPETPDSAALNRFLEARRAADPVHYPDLALAVLKLLGAGEYVLVRAGDDPAGHFGLAARDYAHSTAPNRRFPDLVTQRLLHAMLADAPPPYTDDELAALAEHCNAADKLLRKFDRAMQKRVAALAMSGHVGQVFRGVITGVSNKGVYVRVLDPPFEGRVVQGEAGLDVGMRVQVRLVHTDPVRAFIDFAHVTAAAGKA